MHEQPGGLERSDRQPHIVEGEMRRGGVQDVVEVQEENASHAGRPALSTTSSDGRPVSARTCPDSKAFTSRARKERPTAKLPCRRSLRRSAPHHQQRLTPHRRAGRTVRGHGLLHRSAQGAQATGRAASAGSAGTTIAGNNGWIHAESVKDRGVLDLGGTPEVGDVISSLV